MHILQSASAWIRRAFLGSLLISVPCFAHTLPISFLTLVPDTNYLHLELVLNPFELSFFSELDLNRNGRVEPAELASQQTNVTQRLLHALKIQAGAKVIAAEVAGASMDLEGHHLTLRAHYPVDARAIPVRVKSSLAEITSGSHVTEVTFGTGPARQAARLDMESSEALFAAHPGPAPATPGAAASETAAPLPELLMVALPVLVLLALLGHAVRTRRGEPRAANQRKQIGAESL